MIAALIFVISFLTLLQFFISYCRSLLAESQQHELSEEAREICGIKAWSTAGAQFRRLAELIALCPEPRRGDRHQVRAVAAYYNLLGFARVLLGWLIPSTARWFEAEQSGCAYAAAVALDRRIAYTRMLMAQQANHQL